MKNEKTSAEQLNDLMFNFLEENNLNREDTLEVMSNMMIFYNYTHQVPLEVVEGITQKILKFYKTFEEMRAQIKQEKGND